LKRATKKRIVVSVTNDLVSDNRVHKVSSTLTDMGFSVTLIGREMPNSLRVGERPYSIKRFRLLFNKGPLFYTCINLRLFFYLLFTKVDILLANDLDILPGNFIISRIRSKPLIYDSHEYFTEVPELITRPVVKRIWEWMEKKMVPHVNAAYTVCGSIAGMYTEKYNIPFKVVRNFPVAATPRIIYSEEKIILYQGAVNAGRGLEPAIRAMHYLKDARFLIAGDGDLFGVLKDLVRKEGLTEKVEFLGRLPIHELMAITPRAAVGLSIEEDLGLNYHFALPNKLFDYIQAEVPVLVTNLPEMTAVVNKYEIGEIITDLNPLNLSRKLADMIDNTEKRKIWKQNLKKASTELVWENEEKVLHSVFMPFL
jgi:glycosyltransferase involved in cell wall biosynthesis